jgi:hypothetical protein
MQDYSSRRGVPPVLPHELELLPGPDDQTVVRGADGALPPDDSEDSRGAGGGADSERGS